MNEPQTADKPKVTWSQALKAKNEQLEKDLAEARSQNNPATTHAINNPVSAAPQGLEIHDENIGQGKPRELRSEGPSEFALDKPDIVQVARPIDGPKMELEAFMHEKVEVIVHESEDPNAEPHPCIQNGGATQYFIRGKKMWVRRKFIEVLARARSTRYTQLETMDEFGGKKYSMVPHASLRYPFEVTNDPAGEKGRLWLQAIRDES